MALSHAIGDKVEAAYRRGDLLEKRIALMADWPLFLDGVATRNGNSNPQGKVRMTLPYGDESSLMNPQGWRSGRMRLRLHRADRAAIPSSSAQQGPEAGRQCQLVVGFLFVDPRTCGGEGSLTRVVFFHEGLKVDESL